MARRSRPRNRTRSSRTSRSEPLRKLPWRTVYAGRQGGFDVAGKLSGKVALVTGAASGIGRASAIQLASDGAKVVCADLNAEGAESVAKEITRANGEAIGLRLDVSDPADNERAVAAAVKRF